MKKQSEAILPSCALCTHATLISKKTESEKPLLFVLTADATNDDIQLLCPYKNEVNAAFSCRRFSFDPLKYKPKQAPALGALDKDTLLLD